MSTVGTHPRFVLQLLLHRRLSGRIPSGRGELPAARAEARQGSRREVDRTMSRRVLVLRRSACLCGSHVRQRAQEPSAPQAVSAAQLRRRSTSSAISTTRPARTRRALVRRHRGGPGGPALLQTVAEHRDGYVRYRALVLLTGFNDPRTKDAMRASLKSPNDRLRAVAYSFFEHNPDAAMAADFVAALDKEQGEFVRPALVRALAAHAAATMACAARSCARWAAEKTSSGAPSSKRWATRRQHTPSTPSRPSPNSMVRCRTMRRLALGKIGDKRALETLAALQRTAPKATQPAIAAAICLLGTNCESHQHFLVETLRFADKNAGFQDLLRNAAAGLRRWQSPVAVKRSTRSSRSAFLRKIRRARRWRSASATVALRNTPLMLSMLEKHAAPRRGDRARRRGIRHARRGSRQRTILCHRSARLLGVGRRIGRARADRRCSSASSISDGLPAVGRRHRCGERDRPAHQVPGAIDLHVGRSLRHRIVWRPVSARSRTLSRARARVERRRRRHEAEGRVHDGAPRHDWRRSRQSLRERHSRPGRGAAVFPRLPRDRPAAARRGGADRQRRRARMPGERLRAHRRRDRRDARLLCRRRVRHRRLHRRHRRSIEARSRAGRLCPATP